MIRTDTDRILAFAAALDEMDSLDTDDARFEPAVTRYCLLYSSLSPSERDAAYQFHDAAIETKSLDDLRCIHARLADESRTLRMRQIGFKLGVTISSALLGGRRG